MLSFFPFDILCFFVKNQVIKDVWIDIQVFYLIPLVLLFVLMQKPGYLHYCSPVLEFKVRDCDASRSSLFVQDCFGYPGFFPFLYEVEYCSFEVCNDFCWDFDRHCIEFVDCFW